MSTFGFIFDVMTVPDFIIYAGALSGALVAIVGTVRKCIIDPAAKKFTQSVREEIVPLEVKIDIIKHEVEMNSGRSLKDAVIKGFNDNDKRMSTLEAEMSMIKHFLKMDD
jgi:Na+-translocating ferredoxin:NAD+ oxidoreductase RnfG subunit